MSLSPGRLQNMRDILHRVGRVSKGNEEHNSSYTLSSINDTQRSTFHPPYFTNEKASTPPFMSHPPPHYPFHRHEEMERDGVAFGRARSDACRDVKAPPPPVFDPEKQSRTNLFISNLSHSVEQSHLLSAFAPFGEILSAAVMRNIHTGESLGTAFVRFAKHEEAERAIFELSGKKINGRSILVQFARRQHDGAPVGEARRKINKLFVRNIPLDVTPSELHDLFVHYGPVKSVSIHKDTAPGNERNAERHIAFITFAVEGAADRAASAVHNTRPFSGCGKIPLMVKLAEDAPNRQSTLGNFNANSHHAHIPTLPGSSTHTMNAIPTPLSMSNHPMHHNNNNNSSSAISIRSNSLNNTVNLSSNVSVGSVPRNGEVRVVVGHAGLPGGGLSSNFSSNTIIHHRAAPKPVNQRHAYDTPKESNHSTAPLVSWVPPNGMGTPMQETNTAASGQPYPVSAQIVWSHPSAVAMLFGAYGASSQADGVPLPPQSADTTGQERGPPMQPYPTSPFSTLATPEGGGKPRFTAAPKAMEVKSGHTYTERREKALPSYAALVTPPEVEERRKPSLNFTPTYTMPKNQRETEDIRPPVPLMISEIDQWEINKSQPPQTTPPSLGSKETCLFGGAERVENRPFHIFSSAKEEVDPMLNLFDDNFLGSLMDS